MCSSFTLRSCAWRGLHLKESSLKACARLKNALCICTNVFSAVPHIVAHHYRFNSYHVPQQLPARTTFVAVVNKETPFDPPDTPETVP